MVKAESRLDGYAMRGTIVDRTQDWIFFLNRTSKCLRHCPPPPITKLIDGHSS